MKAISAGLDLELPALDCFGEPLKTAVATGKLPMSTIDTAVRRVLTTKMRLGLFESPYADSTGLEQYLRTRRAEDCPDGLPLVASYFWPTRAYCLFQRKYQR